MTARKNLTPASRALALITLLVFTLTACQHTAPPPPKPEPPKVKFSETHDREIKEIMDLASKDRWEEAQAKAAALHQRDPKNPLVERVNNWVIQAGQKRREQALENKIRDIDSKNSVFAPSVESLLLEKKDRGLPATKGGPDTVQSIQKKAFIPESQGKKSYEKGPLFDFEST